MPKPCREPSLHVANADSRGLLQSCLAGPGWVAGMGWQRAVRYEMFILALIMPFAASLCNSQLCVLHLAQNHLIS